MIENYDATLMVLLQARDDVSCIVKNRADIKNTYLKEKRVIGVLEDEKHHNNSTFYKWVEDEKYPNGHWKYDGTLDRYYYAVETSLGDESIQAKSETLDVEINIDQYKSKVHPEEDRVDTFIYNGNMSSWILEDEVVNISDYGITYIGNPENNDTIVVSYSTSNKLATYYIEKVPLNKENARKVVIYYYKNNKYIHGYINQDLYSRLDLYDDGDSDEDSYDESESW